MMRSHGRVARWGAWCVVLSLELCTVDSLQAAPKAKAAASPPVDELERATRDLDAFNQKTNGAQGSDADPSLALQSAELQLKVVEATTGPRVKSAAQLEQNLARLADVKAKLGQAKRPKKGAAPLAPATLTSLEQRHSAALDAALLLQAGYLLDVGVLVGYGPAQAILAGRPDSHWATFKRNLSQVKSAAAKAEAKQMSESAKNSGWPRDPWMTLGTMAFSAIRTADVGDGSGDVNQACRKLGKDELAWQLLSLQGATQIAMTKVPPHLVVAERMPHHDATTPAGVARDVKRALFGNVLDGAAAIEAAKGCTARPAAPLAPPGAGAHFRAMLAAAAAAEPLEELVTNTGYAVMGAVGPASLNQPPQVSSRAKQHRAELDKRAQNGARALTRYKATLQRSKDGNVDPKDAALARDELSAAKAAGLQAAKLRAQVRKQEDELMATLAATDQAITKAKDGMKAAREAQKQLAASVAQHSRDAGQDATKKAAAARAAAVAKRAPDVLAYADGRIAEARAALQKHVTKAALGTIANYPKRVAQAQKEDDAIAQRLRAIDEQLKEVDALLKQDSARCDVRKIDWKNAKYEFGALKDGVTSTCAMLDFETGETLELISVDYADLDGDGTIEALVQIQGLGCGRGAMNTDRVYVFGVDARCAPVQRGYAEFQQCAKRKLAGKTLQVDVNECSWDGKGNQPKSIGPSRATSSKRPSSGLRGAALRRRSLRDHPWARSIAVVFPGRSSPPDVAWSTIDPRRSKCPTSTSRSRNS